MNKIKYIMSFSETILTAININVKKYIKEVADKYNLNEEELTSIWTGKLDNSKNNELIKTNDNVKLDPELMKLNKKELQEICKSKNLPVSGTKNDIIIRIMGNIKPKTQPTISSNNKKTSSPPSVIKKLVEKIPTIQIRKNNFGNFEHSETKIVFNNVTKRAYGKQNDDGTVSELSHEDIDICHKYKFAYDIPENLDKKGNIDDDNDEELDNEEDDDEELIDEEELEAIDDEAIDDEAIDDEEEVEEEYYEDD